MDCVVTLIASPASGDLSGRELERAQGALSSAGDPMWLAPGIAADLFFDRDNRLLRDIEHGVRAALEGSAVDVVVQPTAHRRKKLLVADMDSTMIGQECIDELADQVGLKAHVAAITERAMRGEIAFEPALRERVALLKGLPVSVVAEVLRDRISLTPGGPVLLATMRAHGARTALVSGGFTLFTGPIARKLRFHEDRANRLVVQDGLLAGQVEEPILGREAKRERLMQLVADNGLQPEETLAVGDGANDLAMLEAAGLGVAYHAKPAVAAAAHARIDHCDLTALLYCQGYRADQFVWPSAAGEQDA